MPRRFVFPMLGKCCAFAGFALLAPILVSAAPASAGPIGCGSLITTNVILQQDLSCPDTDGLIIGASNITVDLNGHTLDGGLSNPTTPQPRGPHTSGISFTVPNGCPVSSITTGTTVKNGTIRNFDAGVDGLCSSGTDYVGIRAFNNAIGFWFYVPGSAGQIRLSLISGNGQGIGLAAARVSVSKSIVANNGGGVGCFQATGSTFVANDIHDNGTAFSLSNCDQFLIQNNAIRDNDVGIRSQDMILAHTVTGNAFFRNRIGVALFAAQAVTGGMQITKNSFVSNRAAGVAVFPSIGTFQGTAITGNAFLGNGFSPNGTVDGHGSIVNDALHVESLNGLAAGITVANNLVVKNADYGIEAPGVVDGGGNFAAANGNPAQCLGVTCRTFRGF